MKETHLAPTTTCILKYTDTNTQRTDGHVHPLTQISTKLPSNQSQRHPRSQTHTSLIESHFASCALMPSQPQPQPLPFCTIPSHAEIAEQRAVKGVCALSLGGIKDVESCHAFPLPPFPFGFVSSSHCLTKGAGRVTVDLCKNLLMADDTADKTVLNSVDQQCCI